MRLATHVAGLSTGGVAGYGALWLAGYVALRLYNIWVLAGTLCRWLVACFGSMAVWLAGCLCGWLAMWLGSYVAIRLTDDVVGWL